MRAAPGLAARLAPLLAAGVFLPGAARANPLDVFGFGSRQAALGGAVSADVSDFSACYYNPAGLARARGLELAVGYFDVEHALSMNGRGSGVDPVRGVVGGAVAPGRLGEAPFAFGLGFHLPDARLARVRALPQAQPRWELYDNRNQRLWFGVDGAIALAPWLQVGGGVTYMAATTAFLDVGGHLDLAQPTDSSLRDRVDANLGLVVYPDFGVRIDLSRSVALALTYRGQFSLDLDVHARLLAGAGLGRAGDLTTLALALQADTIEAFLPQQAVLGASWKPFGEALHANADLTWVNWSAYVPPVARVQTSLEVPPPAGGWPPGITPPTAPGPTVVLPIEMHDRVVPHLGVEWRALVRGIWEARLRGGYEFARSPIGAQSGATNYVDRDRHSVSLGAGVRLPAPAEVLPGEVRFDVHAQLSVLPTVLTTKSNPADLVGDYTAGGHIWNVGATAAVGF
jgi:long-chain fatty acid transport protein